MDKPRKRQRATWVNPMRSPCVFVGQNVIQTTNMIHPYRLQSSKSRREDQPPRGEDPICTSPASRSPRRKTRNETSSSPNRSTYTRARPLLTVAHHHELCQFVLALNGNMSICLLTACRPLGLSLHRRTHQPYTCLHDRVVHDIGLAGFQFLKYNSMYLVSFTILGLRMVSKKFFVEC